MFAMCRKLQAMVFGEGGGGGGREREEGQKEPPLVAGEPQRRFFSGEITSLTDTSGMIDHQVFFAPSMVMGGRSPQVGAMVHVTAERPHPLACWRATRVEVTECWDSDLSEERTMVVGFISKISETLAVVDCATSELTFDPQCHSGWFESGDWVSVGVRVGGCDEGEEVEFVQPLREKEVKGQVTTIGRGYGFVDDDIIFSTRLCGRSHVRVGDDVSVMCVECRHHQATWRAVSMTTLSSPHLHTLPSSPNSPSLPLLPPSQPSHSCVSLMEDKCGLVMSELCEGVEVTVGEEKIITITIRNTRSHDHLLTSVKFLPCDPQLALSLPPSLWCSCDEVGGASVRCEGGEGGCDDCSESDGEDGKIRSLSEVGVVRSDHVHVVSEGSLDVPITIRAQSLGQISCLVLLSFLGGVKIGRRLRAKVTNSDLESLGPAAMFRGRGTGGGRGERGGRGGRENLRRMNGAQRVIPGEKPHRSKLLRLPRRLKCYPVPEDMAECVSEGDDPTSIRPQLAQPLCMKNYYSRFSCLLHLEEIQREMDMRHFDLFCVPLRSKGQYLSLEVPGLTEGRPSLLIGDRVIASVAREDEEEDEGEGERYWEGCIHQVGKDHVLLMFAGEFHQNCHAHKYDVIFQYSRTSFRRMHHAIEISHLLGSKVLFPGQQSPKQPLIKLDSQTHAPNSVSVPFQFFNEVLNPCQRSAVRRILSAQNRPSPYVVFGPPGTGKTVTLVEAILQINQRSSASRVLACAPSNSAADLLMERLLASGVLGEGEIVRLNAIQRALPPLSIADHCMDTNSMDIAVRCRVVVSTCVTAGALHSLGLPVGHFSHVLVDEAGQATEPEALLPATLLSGDTQGQLVLAGDPHQLGPVLSSPHSLSLGLSLSLLERTMAREPYLRDPLKYSDHGSYDPLMVTKLVENYRSHSSILSLYSDTFYHGELEPRADAAVASLMCDWEGLPRKGFPLVFHGVRGEDMREGNSPSWFNPVEIIQVVSYVQSLIDNSTYAPKLSDIGIISPYRKQVEKIRWFLGRVGVEGVKVGSVEEFQGQERLVIIISTVRSTSDLVTSDLRHHLGFLGNPKRFNVAISRAKALLVVVGNPHLLSQDPYWSVLVEYAADNGAYIGCPLSQDSGSDDDSLSRDPELDYSSTEESSS